MGILVAYSEHSGSLQPGTTGYDTTLFMPPSFLNNFTIAGSGGKGQFCFFAQLTTVATMRPWTNDYTPDVQVFDNVHGWTPILSFKSFLTVRNPPDYVYVPSEYTGAPQALSVPWVLHVDNPVPFRIAYTRHIDQAAPALSWTRLWVQFSDQCLVPPAVPTIPDPPTTPAVLYQSIAETTIMINESATKPVSQGSRNRAIVIA